MRAEGFERLGRELQLGRRLVALARLGERSSGEQSRRRGVEDVPDLLECRRSAQRPLGGERWLAGVEIERCGGEGCHRARHREPHGFGACLRGRRGVLGVVTPTRRKE